MEKPRPAPDPEPVGNVVPLKVQGFRCVQVEWKDGRWAEIKDRS